MATKTWDIIKMATRKESTLTGALAMAVTVTAVIAIAAIPTEGEVADEVIKMSNSL